MSTRSTSLRSTPAWFYRDIDLGDTGDDVLIVQKKLGAGLTGVFDDATAARVRGLEKIMGRRKQTGRVDETVAAELGEKPTAGQVPDWYGTDAQDQKVRDILRLSMLEPINEGVRRFQSANGLPLTGEVDEDLAVMLGDRSA